MEPIIKDNKCHIRQHKALWITFIQGRLLFISICFFFNWNFKWICFLVNVLWVFHTGHSYQKNLSRVFYFFYFKFILYVLHIKKTSLVQDDCRNTSLLADFSVNLIIILYHLLWKLQFFCVGVMLYNLFCSLRQWCNRSRTLFYVVHLLFL